MSNNFPPQAYLIGAEKAGTTTLAFLLNQHADIQLAESKEPNYFTYEWDRGIDWYRSCFPQSGEQFYWMPPPVIPCR